MNKQVRAITVTTFSLLGILCIASGIGCLLKEKQVTKKTVLVIVQKKQINKEETIQIVPKELEITANTPLSIKVADYLQVAVTNEQLANLKLDTSTVDVTKAGVYTYTITYLNQVYQGHITVKENVQETAAIQSITLNNFNQEQTAKIGEMKEIFRKGSWINVAITMLLRNIYNFLWYFTIIGGIIKMYEYRMIPYILAENPKANRKEVFKLSKQMMKGNKWKTFLLDVSFFGWNILSMITLGLLNILYVNPYKASTNAELYVELRNIAKKEKYEYIQNLNDETIK